MDGRTFEAEFVTLVGGKVLLRKSKRKTVKIPKEKFSEEDLKYIQLETPPDFNISFSKQSRQRVYPEHRTNQPVPESAYYVFSVNLEQTSIKSYDQELQVEIFVIGAEVKGDRHILLDRQKNSFTLTKENKRSARFSGKTIELTEFIVGHNAVGMESRGRKYSSYLVVVTDQRGKIIAHKTPKKWIFENYENLKELSVGNYFEKTCTRVRPTRPQTVYY